MKRKIKLLVITHMFPTKYNPIAGIYSLNQLKELKKYCNIKVVYPHAYVPKIKILNPYHRFSKIPFKERIKGIIVYHPKYFMFPRVLFVPRFLNLFLTIESFFSYVASKKTVEGIIKRWGPDIIHTGAFSEALLAVELKNRYKKPLIITTGGEDITKYAKAMLSKYLSKYFLKNADAIICQSRFLEDEIKKIGIKNKFYIIPMGAKTEIFRVKDKKKIRKKINLPKDRKIILFVGHLVKRKGAKYLIKALKSVLEKEKNILCCIIGKGPEEGNLKKLTSILNLNKYVMFLGQKNHNEVASYMHSCDIFVLPSLNEGLPVVLCEALACGKPVVATKVAGTPELVKKDSGLLVKPKNSEDLAEKIILALNKKWEKEKLLKRAQEFSIKTSVKKLLNVYKNFLRKNP